MLPIEKPHLHGRHLQPRKTLREDPEVRHRLMRIERSAIVINLVQHYVFRSIHTRRDIELPASRLIANRSLTVKLAKR